MKITFVQNDGEKEEAYRVIKDRLSIRGAKTGTWILPPKFAPGERFMVVDCPTEDEVFVETFDTIDGALLYALGVRDDDNPVLDSDYAGSLKDWGTFV